MPRRLFVRTDATPRIGLGHVMRCTALAQSWADGGGQVTFVGDFPTAVQERLTGEGFSVAHAETTIPGDTTVLLDGYDFDLRHQQELRRGRKLIVIDDMAPLPEYDADLVLNPNLGAERLVYAGNIGERLLGTRFTPLRREFLQARRNPTTEPVARRLLITLGGSDPLGLTPQATEALRSIDNRDLQIRVLHGPAAPATRASPDGRISYLHDVRDMPALLTWADLALSAAGSTAWEMAYMGLPALLIAVADNQRPIGQGLQERGAAIDLGEAGSVDWATLPETVASLLDNGERRSRMSAAGKALIDGKGASRVFARL